MQGGSLKLKLNDKETAKGAGLFTSKLNPVRKGLVSKPEEWRWSGYNNFALDKVVVAGCPIQVDGVRLPEGYRT